MKSDDIKRKMDALFQELGLEEELEKAAKGFVENFMISGEETEELSEALERAPDSLIDLIWENIEEGDPHLFGREEKEALLCKDIPQDLGNGFIYLNEYQLRLLFRLKAGFPLEERELASVRQLFCRRGWIFSFVDAVDNKCTFVMMRQIQNVLDNQLNDEKVQMLLGLVMGFRKVLQAALNLYGVFEREQLFRLFILYVEKEEDGIDPKRKGIFYQLGNQALEEMENQDEGFWLDADYVISNDFEDQKDYQKFLKKMKNQEYFIPDIPDMDLYSESIIDQQNAHYKRLARILQGLIGNDGRGDNLMVQIEYQVTEEDMSSAGLLDILTGHDILFKNQEAAEDFFRCFNNWGYEVKRWSNRGYSDKELGYRKNDWIPDISVVIRKKPDDIKKIKIGRNDLCPCGSGKKYKKCCIGK